MRRKKLEMPRRKSHSRAGKIWEKEIRNSLNIFQRKHPSSFFWHRLSDTYDYIRIPNIILPCQPADFIVLYKGRFFLIEAKSRHTDRFDLEHLPQHQKDGLYQVSLSGGKGLILFSFRKKRPVKCYVQDIHSYLQLEKKAVKEGRKSIPEEWIAEASLHLKRIPRKGFDLSPIFL
jgi:penicillin-binding protein-related factor A (putative recombinase)